MLVSCPSRYASVSFPCLHLRTIFLGLVAFTAARAAADLRIVLGELIDGRVTLSCLRHVLVQDGTKKMSKSAESDASRINLLDPPDVLSNKIKRAKTDGELPLVSRRTSTALLSLVTISMFQETPGADHRILQL